MVFGREARATEAAAGSPRCTQCAPPQKLRPVSDPAEFSDGSGVKTRDQLEQYLRCYATPHQTDYDQYYKKLIDLAGNTFQASYLPDADIPVRPILKPEDYAADANGNLPFLVRAKPEVIKCLVLRESGWDATAQSPTGAKGLGQQTEVNVSEIKCLISGCRKPFQVNGGVESREVPAEEWAQKVWNAYFVRARKLFSARDWNHLMTNAVTGAPCSQTMELKDRDANCAVNSLAAVALDQMKIELEMRKASPLYKNSSDHDFTTAEGKQLSLVQGSSHDAGVGAARASVRSSNRPDQWGSALGRKQSELRREEIADYRKYLNNCLSRDNWQPTGNQKAKDCGAGD